MRKRFILLFLPLLMGLPASVPAQKLSVKSNLLYDAMTNLNLGVEVGLGKKTSLDVSAQLNPWVYNKATNSKLQNLMVQPEFRYWLCERFAGHFLAANALWMKYNVGAMDLPFGLTENTLAEYRYQGSVYSGGVGYGYQWVFQKRWAIEAELGVGYAYILSDKYRCETCGEYLGRKKTHFFGPTKAAVSLIFFIK